MGLTGLEPVTLRLSSACSNQLSYRPVLTAEPPDCRFSIWNKFRASGHFENLKSAICNLRLEIELEARGFEPLRGQDT
jgi:hypothetical protein